jgi:chloride channel 7
MRVSHLTDGDARRSERNGIEAFRRSGTDAFERDAVRDATARVDVGTFMHRAPLSVQADHPASRTHVLFTTLGLRHLCVVDRRNRVVGVITRKDVNRAAGE